MNMKRRSTHCGLSAKKHELSHEACPELDNGSPDHQTEQWLSLRLEQAPRGPSTVLAGAEWSSGEEEPHRTSHMLLFHTCFLSSVTKHKQGEYSEHLATHVLSQALNSYRAVGQHQQQTTKKQHKIKSTLIGSFVKYLGLS